MPAKGSIIQLNLNITKNDVDEDGLKAKLHRELPVGARRWQIFQMTYHFRVGGPKEADKLQRVDSFRIAA